MARAVVTRTWRDTTPEEIELTLSSLWRDVARQEQVARAVMSNLVVYRERGGRGAHAVDTVEDLPLDDVVARHPSRVILIDHERADEHAAPPCDARVGVVIFGPPHARYAVEEIAVQSACAVRSLPSIIRRVLRGDVPTSVWWAQDLSLSPPIEEIVFMGRQLVYDSRQWRDVRRGILALTPLVERDERIDLADLNWRRLAPLRRALVHASESMNLDPLRHARVRIRHRPGDGALAWLTFGWLSAQLAWARNVKVPVEETRQGDDVLTVIVGEGEHEMTAAMNSHHVRVKHRRDAAPFSVSVPHERDSDRIAAELRNLSHDSCLDEALLALARRFNDAEN
jgi:glucose-6-phosphate dehydrogenase assembly protein OpcA